LRQLQGQRRQAPGDELMTGLDWLAQLDQRQLLQTLPQPQLHLLAEHDGLVPAQLQQAFEGLLQGAANARVRLLGGACHLAPLASATEVAAATSEFLAAADLLGAVALQGVGPDKRDIASSFSRAAASYDSVAQLQRDVGARLLARLPAGEPAAAVVLDLGCGTGYFRAGLTACYGSATYIGLDLAPGMVEFARGRAADEGLWVIGDVEALPLAPGSVDLVFSSLAIQWCQRPELFFTELARVLKPGGRCLFTTLGPETLRELRLSWAAVDHRQHVNNFLPPGDLLAAAAGVRGIDFSLECERYGMHYRRVADLLAELKALGAHNMNRDRPAGLTSRRTLQGMVQAYEAWRADGLLPATYDVIFGEVTRQ
jgi:malonyl-CoA O-methyltransferase